MRVLGCVNGQEVGTLTHGLNIFGSVQNLLNRSIDAGRTSVLTLPAPRLMQVGLRYTFTR